MRKRTFYAIYTVCFACIAFLVFRLYFSSGRSLIYHSDAWRQHMRAFAYYGKWLRGIVNNLIHRHTLRPQTWTFGMGYGSDVVTTLHYYCLGDPLTLLSALVPTTHAHYLFQGLIVLRAYLAGATFSAFCFYADKKRRAPGKQGGGPGNDAILAGALIYAFCGWVLYLGMLHPFFVNALVYFPVVLLGAEKLLQREKPMIFILSVFVSAVSSFYYFYMIVCMTVLYVVWRLFAMYGRTAFRRLGRTCAAFLLYGATGTLLSMPVLLPVLLQFAGSPRSDVAYIIEPFYEGSYYKELFQNIIAFVNHPEYDAALGYSPVALLAIFLLFVQRGRRRPLKAAVLLLTGMLLLPVCGWALNGFAFPINRWTWAYSMLAAFLVTEQWADIRRLSLRQLLGALALCAAYTGICAWLGFLSGASPEAANMRCSVLLLFAGWAVCAACALRGQGEGSHRLTSGALLLLIAGGILGNAYYGIAETQDNFAKEMTDNYNAEQFTEAFFGNEVRAVKSAAEREGRIGTFYRYSGRNLVWNAAMSEGVSSTQFFFSLANGVVSDYFQKIGNNDEQSHAYFALDDRAILNTLAGVRYYTLAYDNAFEYQFVPYGYQDTGMIEGYHVYENPAALPLGFTYDGYISKEAWEAMTPVARQEAMLYGAALESAPAGCPEATFDETAVSAACEISCGEGVERRPDGFLVTEEDAQVTLTFAGAADCETYLCFYGLDYDGKRDVVNIQIESMKDGESVIDKKIRYRTPYDQSYSDWHDYIVNLGYAEEAKSTIVITFPWEGFYAGTLSVVCQPMTSLEARISALSENTLEAVNLCENPVSYATNRVTGLISLEQPKLLCLTIPYSTGWRAYVDGERTALLKANAMFMALPLSAGTHVIDLRYETPGMTPGILLSIAGVVLFAAICLRNRASRKKETVS